MKHNRYDFEVLKDVCNELGYTFKMSDNGMRISLSPEVNLEVDNRVGEGEALLGLTGSTWHSHGSVHLMSGVNSVKEYSPEELLISMHSGEVLLVTRSMSGEVSDRWPMHRHQKLDLQYMEPGEEITVQSLVTPDAAINTGT